MKALVKSKNETGLWMQDDVPVPKPGPEEVLIRVRKAAICGTDVHIWKWDEWARNPCRCQWLSDMSTPESLRRWART